jgi:hypothetical protein
VLRKGDRLLAPGSIIWAVEYTGPDYVQYAIIWNICRSSGALVSSLLACVDLICMFLRSDITATPGMTFDGFHFLDRRVGG